MISRREPLLWLQLMAIAVIPLELELMRLVLAGPEFGPAPALERLLIWGLAVVAPGLLLWRRPTDWASLILVRIAPAKRSLDQRRISAIPQPLGLKAALIIGVALLLPLFWWVDQSALLVVDFSPTKNSSRLTALLLAGPLLTVILWQWQQLLQAISLLTRSDQSFADLTPINPADLQTTHLSLGLGLVQLPPLMWPSADDIGQRPETEASENSDAQINQPAVVPAPEPQPDPAESNQQAEVISSGDEEWDDSVASSDLEAMEPEDPLNEAHILELNLQDSDEIDLTGTVIDFDIEPDQESDLDSEVSSPAELAAAIDPHRESSEKPEFSSRQDRDDAASAVAPVAIKPEQPPEEQHSTDLNRQVSNDDTISGTHCETHHAEAETSGSEEGDPEQSAQPPPGGA